MCNNQIEKKEYDINSKFIENFEYITEKAKLEAENTEYYKNS